MSKTIEPRHYRSLVVVDEDRYCGVYSGAEYTAWWGIPPDDIDSGDMSCDEFWSSNPDIQCGKGNTPQEALRDLAAKIDKAGWEFEFKFIEVPGEKYGVSGYMLYDSPEFVKWRDDPEKPKRHNPLKLF